MSDFIAFLDDRPAWRDHAACRGVDPDLFYPPAGALGADAKAVCRGCDVREECLTYALDNGEKQGIWGGLSERERRRIRSARPKAVRRCRWAPCQVMFTPTHNSQVYHSPECAAAADSARRAPSMRVG